MPFDLRKSGLGIVFVEKPPKGQKLDSGPIRVGEHVVLRRNGTDVHVRVTGAHEGTLTGSVEADGTVVVFSEQNVFRCHRNG